MASVLRLISSVCGGAAVAALVVGLLVGMPINTDAQVLDPTPTPVETACPGCSLESSPCSPADCGSCTKLRNGGLTCQ